MPPEIKKFSKKLRSKNVIEVDTQIARWRKKLKKLGLATGRHQAKDREKQRKRAESDKTEVAIVTGKKNFFE